jgi:hypothetical protein
MFEGFGDLIKTLFEGLDLRRRWLAILSFGILFGLCLLIFEQMTGTIYYNNLEKKVELLQELNTLENEGHISSNPELKRVYDETVQELNLRPVRPFRFPTTILVSSVPLWKVISGATLGFVLAFSFIFQKEPNTNAFTAAVIMAILGGIIGYWIPTIYSPWINYIGFPIFQILVLVTTASLRNASRYNT